MCILDIQVGSWVKLKLHIHSVTFELLFIVEELKMGLSNRFLTWLLSSIWIQDQTQKKVPMW